MGCPKASIGFRESVVLLKDLFIGCDGFGETMICAISIGEVGDDPRLVRMGLGGAFQMGDGLCVAFQAAKQDTDTVVNICIAGRDFEGLLQRS